MKKSEIFCELKKGKRVVFLFKCGKGRCISLSPLYKTSAHTHTQQTQP